MARSRIVLKISFALTLCTALGCQDRASQDAWTKVQEGLDEVNKHIGPVTDSISSMSTEQLSTLISFEYKVLSFPPGTSPARVEADLNTAGKERWECFSTTANAEGITVYCKRIPYAMIRYFLRAM